MKIVVNSEIHFYEDDKAFVQIENKSDVGDERFGEILMFCCFTARILGNLKKDPAVTEMAEVLYGMNSQNIKEIYLEDSYKLVNQKPGVGEKRFINNLKYDKDFLKYNSNTRGFGFLGLTIYEYAPIAVYLLLIKLKQQRSTDQEFISWLARSASICGEMFLTQQFKMRNQNQLAFNATATGKEPK